MSADTCIVVVDSTTGAVHHDPNVQHVHACEFAPTTTLPALPTAGAEHTLIVGGGLGLVAVGLLLRVLR